MTQAEILDLSEQFIEEVALAMNAGGNDEDEEDEEGGSIVEGDGGGK